MNLDELIHSSNWVDRAYVAEHGSFSQRQQLKLDRHPLVRKLANGEISHLNVRPKAKTTVINEDDTFNDTPNLVVDSIIGAGLGILASDIFDGNSFDSSDIPDIDFGGGDSGGGGSDF